MTERDNNGNKLSNYRLHMMENEITVVESFPEATKQ